MRELTYVQALNEALREELAKDPAMFVLGEDIGVRGGAFKVTKDLYKEFPGQIIDTPISENAITGVAYGAAISGVKAVAEIMYSDFSLVGIDHIVNSAAKARTMFGGQVTIPVVFRLPSGGGMQNAAQHSQSLEAMYANIPGLKVVMPTTPEDAKGMLKAAINDYNPIVFMEPRILYFTKGGVPEGEYTTPLGVGKIRRQGDDVTIVAAGANVNKSLEAANILAEQGVRAEVIDMRSIVPYDKQIIIDSVKKTGRLLVTHEAPEMYGIGGEIVSMVSQECFDYLDAPPLRYGSKFIPMPYNKGLESQVITQTAGIVEIVNKLMRY